MQLGLFGDAAAQRGEVAPAEVDDECRDLGARLPAGIFLGTSSWSFPGWRGLVWRDEHKEAVLARHGLPAYAAHPLLRAVGIDRGHYAPIPVADLRGYAASVPAGFRFVAKAHDHCTLAIFPDHPRYGAQRGEANPRCFDVGHARDLVVAPFVEGLGAAAGPLVFQFAPQPAPWFGGPRRFAERLYRFLRDLPRGPTYAVELRTPELLSADYAACLRAVGASHCINLGPGMPPPLAQWRLAGRDDQPAVVIRWNLALHHVYESARAAYKPFDRIVDADPVARHAVAILVAEAARRAVPAYVIINNKAEGSSPASVTALAAAIVAGP